MQLKHRALDSVLLTSHALRYLASFVEILFELAENLSGGHESKMGLHTSSISAVSSSMMEDVSSRVYDNQLKCSICERN